MGISDDNRGVKELPHFCNAPWRALETTPHGDMRVCCKIGKHSIKHENGAVLRLPDATISDAWNSRWLADLRQRFMAGEKPEACSVCWDDEAAGLVSERMNHIAWPVNLDNPRIDSLSLKMSNKCNCACRICSKWCSSLWHQEDRKNGLPGVDDFMGVERKITDANIDDWKRVLGKIGMLMLYGGEPLINDEVHWILDHLIDTGRAGNVHLVINTNATVTNMEIWSKLYRFKTARIYLSIDDIGDRYDYQRWPARWESISRDIDRMHAMGMPPNVLPRLYSTISVFNLPHIRQILDEFSRWPWFPVNMTNCVYDPWPLQIYSLPEVVKQMIDVPKPEDYTGKVFWDDDQQGALNGIRGFMHVRQSNITGRDFIAAMDEKLGVDDYRRGQSWRETFPELYGMLQNA